MYLVTNGRLITRDPDGKGYYEHGAVAYEGSRIVEVGEESALRAKYADAQIIDAKGGVIISVKSELGIPVKFIGVGEQIDDLMPFDAKSFAEALI